MFKKRAANAERNTRQVAAATDLAPPLSAAYDTATNDSEDESVVPSDIQRSKRFKPNAFTVATSVTNTSADTGKHARSDPTLVTFHSSRSAALPDQSAISDRHTVYAPKHLPADMQSDSSSLSLPSTQPVKSSRYGPIKVSGYASNITRFDYQPDLCKDYYETGYCGYGDSCKFLHDRTEYKSSQQLEKEFLDKQQQQSSTSVRQKASVIPSKCFICKGDFVQPVQSVCGHYFCEACALSRHRTNARCAVCGKDTGGAFSVARDLLIQPKVKDTDADSDHDNESDER